MPSQLIYQKKSPPPPLTWSKMFIPAPSHRMLNLVRARAYELNITRHAVGLFAHRSSPGWCTAKICPDFAFRPLFLLVVFLL
jgi:hypothetical protein